MLSCEERKFIIPPEIEHEMVDVESLKESILNDSSKKDSVIKEILSLDKDSIKTKFFLDLSYDYYSRGDSANFRFWNEIALNHSLKKKDTLAVAASRWDLANFFYKKKHLDSSYYFYNVAWELYEKKNDDFHAARMLINLATIQRDIKDFQNSEITTIKALKKLQPLEKDYQLYLAFNNLGVTNNHLGQYNEALNFHDKALEIAERLEDEILQALTFNNIGVVYKNLGEYRKAIKNYYAAKAVDSLELKYPELQAMVVDNLAYSRFKVNDSAKIETDFFRALALRKKIDHFSGIATSHLHLGEYYLSVSDTLKAFTHYMKSRKLSEAKGLNEEFLQSTLALAKFGGSKSSDFYNDYIEKATAFQREERAVKNRFAKIRFQTDELIAETQRLTEQKIWITMVSILVIISIMLLYYVKVQRTKFRVLAHEKEQRLANEEIYKLMLKQQSKLEEGRQQERKRISSDLHDGILGRLYGIRLSFEFLNLRMSPEKLEKFNSLTADLQEIEKEVREISHDLASADFFYHSNLLKIIGNLLYEKNQIGKTLFHFEHDEDMEWNRVNKEIQLDLFRIVQEATQNIIKHAIAKEVWVTIKEESSNILLTIKDNGCGFSVREDIKGIGLQNAEARVKKWNGLFLVNSSPNQGTVLTVKIPV